MKKTSNFTKPVTLNLDPRPASEVFSEVLDLFRTGKLTSYTGALEQTVVWIGGGQGARFLDKLLALKHGATQHE